MGVSDRLILLFLPFGLLFTLEDDDLDDIFIFKSSFDFPLWLLEPFAGWMLEEW